MWMKRIVRTCLPVLLFAVLGSSSAHAAKQSLDIRALASGGELNAASAAQMLRALAFGQLDDATDASLDFTMNGHVTGADARAILFYACGGFTDWAAFGERVSTGLCSEWLFDHFSYTGTYDDAKGNYKSENVSVTIEQGRISDSDYYLADIYIQDISCFVTAFGHSEFMGDAESVYQILSSIPGGIVGMNGDFYSINVYGPVVRNGETYVNRVSGYWDLAVLDGSGVLTVYPYGKLKKAALKEMDAYQTWVFGPSLLDESGHAKTKFRSKVLPRNPRSVLGYYEPGHYAFLLVDGRSQTCAGITLADLSQFCEDLGFKSAYNLDGGQSSALVSQSGAIDNPFRDGRAVSDILAIRELPEG